ncbi:MAG: neutral/alkaline non-lysosomal ceramidase N-terminal domain-containing protein, partial [Methanosarcinaceae archaeon]|nr:neutral/alkaline non-lysosomal ceramidase N-terminal domain-containing protein [Methanosarcinaceae archaeon]
MFFKLRNVFLVFCLCMFNQSGVAQLTAGVAKSDITPPIGGLMYGYSARGTNVSNGVHDPLYARALVLDDGNTKLVIVTVDIGAIRRENADNIKRIVRERTNIKNILLVASHTHSGPAQCSKDTENKIAETIVKANFNLIPARIGKGIGEVHEGHNRRMIHTDGSLEMLWENRNRIPTSPVDYQLGVIRIEGSGGAIATLVNFACHPVVAGPENLLISADYPGSMTRILEKEIGGQVMYLPGASGDINPFWDKTPPEEGAFEQIEKMGRALSDEVLRVSHHILDFEEMPKISCITETNLLASRNDTIRAERKIQTEINTLLIGHDLALAMFPGEFFVEHGLSLKERSPFKFTFFVGYCNDQLAYFPTIKSTLTGGYGAASATQVEIGAGEFLVNRALI